MSTTTAPRLRTGGDLFRSALADVLDRFRQREFADFHARLVLEHRAKLAAIAQRRGASMNATLHELIDAAFRDLDTPDE